jgi:hypothetical protein
METDKESLAGHRLGMENGFENSPMAKLLREYGSQDLEAQGLSTETKIQLIIDVEELGPEMIIDRGPERLPGLPCYHLTTKDLDRTQSAATELQIFLQQAARLIEERQSHFLVDPGDTLLPILVGTSSLGQMNAAWKALRLRIELGTKAWRKYIEEYRQTPADNLILSPLSTLPELYNDLEKLEDSDQKLRYLFTNIPHHQQQLSEEGRTSLQKARSSWVHALQMPASIRSAFRLDDKSTPKPTPITQHADLPKPPTNKGKAKECEESLVAPSVSKRGKESGSSKKDKPSNGGQSIWMGMDTPFKSANAWFVEPGKSNRLRQEGTSSQRTLTQDVLLGIATPQPNSLPTELLDWKGRETPPHMASSSRQARSARAITDSSQAMRKDSQERGQHDESLQQPSQQNATGNRQMAEGAPPDDGGDDDSSYSRRSHRSRRQRRRSRTPRPRRRRSSTPRPRPSHHGTDDDDGGGSSSDSSGDGDDGGDSSWGSSSSYSNSSSARSRRAKRQHKKDDVIIPYGTIPPTIKSELKQEDLPSWDGNPKTAISYFWKVQERATLGGYIPAALGYWLWLRLEEGLDVQRWFSTLPPLEQAKMRGHWIDYLKGIKEGYLGRQWQFDIGEEYKAQYFREPSHENELPKTFIARWIMYTRMLVKSDNGGPLEVHLVMARAPLSWRTILLLENIKSTSLLYTKASEHQESLLAMSRTRPSTNITTENLAANLQKLGYPSQSLKPSFHHNFPTDRRANLTLGEPELSIDSPSDHKESYLTSTEPHNSDKTEDQILAEVYQVMKR